MEDSRITIARKIISDWEETMLDHKYNNGPVPRHLSDVQDEFVESVCESSTHPELVLLWDRYLRATADMHEMMSADYTARTKAESAQKNTSPIADVAKKVDGGRTVNEAGKPIQGPTVNEAGKPFQGPTVNQAATTQSLTVNQAGRARRSLSADVAQKAFNLVRRIFQGPTVASAEEADTGPVPSRVSEALFGASTD